MSKAHGIAGSVTPFVRRGRKVRKRECGGKSCYFRLWRRSEDRDNTLDICRQYRQFIQGKLGIVPVLLYTEPAEEAKLGFRWVDWYRLPIPEGKILQDMQNLLRKVGVRKEDGAFFEPLGHVNVISVGSGLAPNGKRWKVIRNRLYAEVSKGQLPLWLTHGLLGERFQFILDAADPLCPEIWEREGKDWIRIESQYPQFGRLYNTLYRLHFAIGSDESRNAVAALEGWIDSILHPSISKPTVGQSYRVVRGGNTIAIGELISMEPLTVRHVTNADEGECILVECTPDELHPVSGKERDSIREAIHKPGKIGGMGELPHADREEDCFDAIQDAVPLDCPGSDYPVNPKPADYTPEDERKFYERLKSMRKGGRGKK